jgi:SNF2 family DNA or RNA helicase
MIEIKDYGYNYNVYYTGDKSGYFKFFNFITKIPDSKKLRGGKTGWKMPKCYLPELERKFEQVELIPNPWDNIGEGMKLSPYCYQKETIKFGVDNGKALLILPCGSGKTPILVGIYHELRKANLTNKPGAIVVKASLKYQWVKEVEKFSDYKAKAIDTPSKAKKKFDNQFEDADLFILNYETLKNEKVVQKLREKDVEVMLYDEIHYINNHKSARAKAAYEFNDVKYIVGATATPITNNPENLFGIFNLINKDLFFSFNKFAKSYIKYAGYGRVAGCKNEQHLRDKIAPYVFIKSEEDVADQLPTLVVNQIYCELPLNMSEVNAKLFEELDNVRKEIEALEKKYPNPKDLEANEDYQRATGLVMAYQTFLQELVDDPRLLTGSDSEMAKQYGCEDSSPKLDTLMNLVTEITDAGSKVCIFTKYQRMQKLLKEELENQLGFKVAIVNGTMSPEERYDQAYNKFGDDDNYKVLIGTDAMAEGISLSKCNYLIEYDLADSYAIQTQRHGRIKRANSVHKTGYVYQIICLESWDEIAAKIIAKKENYDNILIQSLVGE